MPSKNHQNKQGYLHKVLVAGTKPFHYRSGIRTLLGRPENPGTQLSYPLPLTPAGFRYLLSVSFDEVSDIPQPVPAEKDFSESITDRPQTRFPMKRAAQMVNESTGPNRSLDTPHSKQPAPFEAPAPPKSVLGDKSVQREKNPSAGNKLVIGDPKAEQMQIDIPGFSEKARRFPALTPPKKETAPPSEQTPPLNQTAQPIGPQDIIERQAPPAPGETKIKTALPARPALSIQKNDPAERPDLARPAPKTEALNGENVQRSLLQGASTFKNLKGHARTENEIAGQTWPTQNQSVPMASENPQKRQAAPMPHRQAIADARIEQLRQSLQTLKRKTATQEKKTDDAAQQDTSGQHRPPVSLPQPVVIVKRVPIQNRPPAAFWERRYLGRLFRVRPLR